MVNKSTTNGEIKNNGFTPKDVKDALDNLPYNYVVKTQEILEEKVNTGRLPKNFSKQYIISVKNGDADNLDILEAIVQVGLNHIESLRVYEGRKKKKTTPTK